MPASTPKYSWPYPSGTDRVMDGDNAMGALGTAIEDTLTAILGRLAPVSAQLAAAAPITGSAAAPQDLAVSHVFTPATNEVWLGIGLFEFVVTSTGAVTNAHGVVDIDGAAGSAGAFGADLLNMRAVTTALHVATVAGGAPHTAKLRTYKLGAAGMQVQPANTRLYLIRIPT